MKIGVRLFLSSMIFGVVISVVYGFTRHDVVGSVFLGMMALALVIVAIFIVVAEPEANLAGDQPEMSGRHRRRKARSLRPRKLSADPGRGGYNAFILGIVFVPAIRSVSCS